MKNAITLTKLKSFILAILLMLGTEVVYSQSLKKIAVIGIDVQNIAMDGNTMKNLLHLELEKANKYELLDKYDVADALSKYEFPENCFGKSCQVRAGKLLGVDKMLTGSVERYGAKIIFILRLIDVHADEVIKTNVMEYLNQQDYLQLMVRMSLHSILGIEVDKYLVDMLINYDQPIVSLKTTLSLDGPRVGVTYFWGDYATRMQAPEIEGGFNMYPASVLIGYQFETRFLTSGDFQALFEFIPSIMGMESGLIVPSFATMMGFRFNKSGFEFGLGPVIRGVRMADGYYNEFGRWVIASDIIEYLPDGVVLEKAIDRRGELKLTSGMIFALGKTFRSGYLNMPVNLYYSPRKEGSVIGLTLGFNVAKKPNLN